MTVLPFIAAPRPPTAEGPAPATGNSAGRSGERTQLNTRLVQLLAEAARGGQEAFAELYDQTHVMVYGAAFRILAPQHAAEVTQETYLEVWLKAATYDPKRGGVIGWMSMIAHRRAVDRVRSVATAAARDLRSAIRDEATRGEDLCEDIADKLDAVQVRGALGSLTAVQREAVLLKYVECRTLKEIASQLGLPMGTVKTRIRDGVTRLRTTLGPGLAQQG